MTPWLARLLDAVFPETCRLCRPDGRSSTWVCDRCIAASPPSRGATCASCGREVPGGAAGHVGPPIHSATWYAVDDQIPAALAVRLLKYDGRRRLARPLATLLHRRAEPPRDAVVVPVPIHSSRLRRRGFNQAALIARHFGRLAGLPAHPLALRRTRETQAQAHLARTARLANLRGAFTASRRLVEHRHIALVDDVATTGATLAACSAALHLAGAREVTAFVIARRPLLSAGVRTG